MIIYIIILTIVIVITVYLFSYIQNKITYYPEKLESEYDFHLEGHQKNLRKQINKDITLKEYNIKSNKNTINLLHFNNKDTDNLIIYAHGNAQNISSCMDIFYKFGESASIILFDYSGYGKSTGSANTKDICKDIYNVWLFAIKDLQVKPKNIILYGFSLGGAILSYLLYKLDTKNKELPKAIIIQSSFINSRYMAKQLLNPFIYYVFKFLIDNTFNSIEYLEQVNDKLKIMIVHSKDDDIVDYEHAQLFLEKINCDHIIINGTHNNQELTEDFYEAFKFYLSFT